MKNTGFIGRKREFDVLKRSYESKDAQLIIVYGRRRVGKTYLIDKVFQDEMAFKITGSFGEDASFQLANFSNEISRRSKEEPKKYRNWGEAFEALRDYIDSLPSDKRQIVFIDELPWLDTPRSKFLSYFEYFWNNYGSSKDNLMLIVAGSASSWLSDKLINNKGGFFNRHSARIYLEPFTLGETKDFLSSRGFMLSDYEIAETYMVMGGIPFYLNQLDSALSLNSNIDNLFFKKHGLLWDEFDRLYDTLFGKDPIYKNLVSLLASSRYGLSKKEIAQKIGVSNNGHVSTKISNLIDSGFVMEMSSISNRKEKVYLLSDFFTMFYFKFVKDNQGKNETFWSNSIDNPSRRSWLGFSFELLCKLHIQQIKKALGISGINADIYSFNKKGEVDKKGCQIDLVIDRRDGVATLVEMKFSAGEFLIEKEYSFNLANKLETFRKEYPKKSLQLVFVSTYGLASSPYSHLVSSSLSISDLF